MYFQDFQKYINQILKFGHENFGQVVISRKNKWQKSEERLRKLYFTRVDFVPLLLKILLGSF